MPFINNQSCASACYKIIKRLKNRPAGNSERKKGSDLCGVCNLRNVQQTEKRGVVQTSLLEFSLKVLHSML